MKSVAPLAGAWIEIAALIKTGTPIRKSLPSRERGLKFRLLPQISASRVVAPLAGAWIEICLTGQHKKRNSVAPLAGAWIEIIVSSLHPITAAVAPLAGAWIEIVFWAPEAL